MFAFLFAVHRGLGLSGQQQPKTDSIQDVRDRVPYGPTGLPSRAAGLSTAGGLPAAAVCHAAAAGRAADGYDSAAATTPVSTLSAAESALRTIWAVLPEECLLS